jgi:hypothetical protein
MNMIGADALSNAWTQGLEELRSANMGEMAMDAPSIQPVEAPVIEQNSYVEMLQQMPPQQSPDMGMEL